MTSCGSAVSHYICIMVKHTHAEPRMIHRKTEPAWVPPVSDSSLPGLRIHVTGPAETSRVPFYDVMETGSVLTPHISHSGRLAT